MKKILFLFVLFIVGCNKSDINYLEIYYLPKSTLTPSVVDCNLLDIDVFKDLKNKKITHDHTVREISLLINNLQANNLENDLDARIKVIVKYENKKDTLCLGEFFGTSLNGVKMKDNEKLYKLIKNITYEK